MTDDEIAAELCLEDGESLADDLSCFQCGWHIDLEEGFWTMILPAEEVLTLPPTPNARESHRIGLKLQAYIRKRDRGVCGICGRRLSRKDCTAHHIIAFSKGGATSEENLVVACVSCQEAIGNDGLPSIHVLDTEFVRELSVSEMELIADATHTDKEFEELLERLRWTIERRI